MLKRLLKFFFHKDLTEYLLTDIPTAEIVQTLKRLPQQEVLNIFFKLLRPPRQGRELTEVQELAIRANVSNEEYLKLLENKEYDYLISHIRATTPEERLILKGRYLEISEEREKIKDANKELIEKDAEEALQKTRQ